MKLWTISVSEETARRFAGRLVPLQVVEETDDRIRAAANALLRYPRSWRETFRHALIWLRVLPEYRHDNRWDRRWIKPWDDKQPGLALRVAHMAFRCARDGMHDQKTWPELVRHCEKSLGYKARPWYVHRWFKS